MITISTNAQIKEVKVTKTEIPPDIDGRLNDHIWQTFPKDDRFLQFDPENGLSSSENIILLVNHDTDNLYVAFLYSNKNVSEVAAFLTFREQFDSE